MVNGRTVHIRVGTDEIPMRVIVKEQLLEI